MPYDIALRFSQALDPSALTTVETCLHALTVAIIDCRNAGKPHDSDPAVLLLARHLGSVAEADAPSVAQLRRRCLDAIADLKRHPALIALAYKGVSYDAPSKALFHSDGRKAMARLADALGLARGTYDIRSNQGGIAVSGEITLHGEEVYVQLGLGCLGPGHEVMFRRVAGRTDNCGERNHWASVQELVHPDIFAVRLRRDLHLTISGTPSERLFA